MGTAISLDVAGVSLISSWNHIGINHGSLFQERDRKPVRRDQINYNYPKNEVEHPTPAEMAFTRPLKEVAQRLDLLGFNLDRVRREYETVAENWRQERFTLLDDINEALPDLMSFAEFRQLATEHPLESLDGTYDPDASEEKIRGRFADVQFDRIPKYQSWDYPDYSERSFFSSLLDVLDPYSMMRLLANAKANENAPVVWQYGPLVEAGWATEREFVPGARRNETFLIATEGVSDVRILKHALALLRPEIADFFRFVDVSEGHPFPGTGNLVKFAEGLAKIDVQNKVLFLFDNDAEGLEAHERLSKLTLPKNMRGAMLPQLKPFRQFPAQGPEGLATADINHRAAAIECYLDLNLKGRPPAQVRWTNYKKDLGVYHGALDYKDSYGKAFLKQTPETIAGGGYDVSKILVLLDYLVATCTEIALDQWNESNVVPHF
jgi:HEPN/Toprim N-terminal domain 1